MAGYDMWMFDTGPKAIADCTREELLEIIKRLSAEVSEEHSPEAIRERALGRVEMVRRGELRLSAE